MPSSDSYLPIHDSEMRIAPGTSIIPSRLNLNEVAEVAVCVREPSSGADLESFVESQNQLPARGRQHLSRTDLAERYGADPKDLDAIAQFANDNGLSVSAIHPDFRTISLSGKLSDLQQAFHVNLVTYRSPEGNIYRGYTGQVQLPGSISNIVKAVIGLDTKPAARSHIRKVVPARSFIKPASAAQTPSYTAVQIARFYDFPTDLDGTGQCLGILEFGGGYRMDDLNTYFKMLGIDTPQIVSVSVKGAANSPSGGSSTEEVTMDIEVAGSIAPKAHIVVYFAPNTDKGFCDAIATALHDSYNNPSVLSISWGGAEWTWGAGGIYVMNLLLMSAAAMGKTICAASGDQGYTLGESIPGSKANVNYPASHPHVLGCGGTHLDAAAGKRLAESVWDDASGATGGGVSAHFGVPSYQKDAGVPASVNPPHNPGRGVPDVAADADPNSGYVLTINGQTSGGYGGTSAATPVWAALLTLINQSRGSPVGWVNPLLYSAGVASTGFNEILAGNNGPGGYQAGPGWNACTGLGTPKGSALLELL